MLGKKHDIDIPNNESENTLFDEEKFDSLINDVVSLSAGEPQKVGDGVDSLLEQIFAAVGDAPNGEEATEGEGSEDKTAVSAIEETAESEDTTSNDASALAECEEDAASAGNCENVDASPGKTEKNVDTSSGSEVDDGDADDVDEAQTAADVAARESTDDADAARSENEKSEDEGNDGSVSEEICSSDEKEPSCDEDNEDDEDETLMAALGYSETPIGRPAVVTATRDGFDLSDAYAYNGEEYASKEQGESIKKRYRSERLRALIRLGATAVCVLLLFVFDVFGKKFGGALNMRAYPAVYVMASLQILLICAAFSYKKMICGIRDLFRAKTKAYSIAAVSVCVTVVYDIVIAAIGTADVTLYDLPAAVCLLFVVLGDLLEIERQAVGFNIVSDSERICSIDEVDAETLEKYGIADKNVRRGKVFEIKSGEVPSGYFRHTNRRSELDGIYKYVIPPVLALALVVFIISLAAGRPLKDAANVFVSLVLFGLPSFMLIASVYPFFFVGKKGARKSYAVLGESDAGDISDISAVVLDERDAFDENAIRIDRITMCGNGNACDVYGVMNDVSAIAEKVGGTFAHAFGKNILTAETDGVPSAKNNICDENGGDVEVREIVDKGIVASVGDGEYLIGSAEFLKSRGVATSSYYDAEYIAETAGGTVIHVARDGKAVLKFFVSYTPNERFVKMVKELSARSMRTVLKCVDPNVDSQMLMRTVAVEGQDISVIRVSFDEAKKAVPTGGVVADASDMTSLLDAADTCRSYQKWTKLNVYICGGLLAAGVLIAAFLGALGATIGMSSLYIVLFQLLAILPSVALPKFMLE